MNEIPVDIVKIHSFVSNLRKFHTNPQVESLSKKITQADYKVFVFGGVDMNIINSMLLLDEIENERENREFQTQEISKICINEIHDFLPNTKLCTFPFQPNFNCSDCFKELTQWEIIASFNTKYCNTHNPFICKCSKIIKGKYITANSKNYHKDCFNCSICQQSIDSQYVVYDNENFHAQCLEDYNDEKDRIARMIALNNCELENNYKKQAKEISEALEFVFNEAECFEVLKFFGGSVVDTVEVLTSLVETRIIQKENHEKLEEIDGLTHENKEDVLFLCSKGYEFASAVES